MFHIKVNYPKKDEEAEIIRRTTGVHNDPIRPVINGDEIIQCQKIVRKVPVPDHVNAYVLDLVRRCRPDDAEALPFTRELISWGPGPRACQQLILGGNVRAILQGRPNVVPEDIAAWRIRFAPSHCAHLQRGSRRHHCGPYHDRVLQAVPQQPAGAAL